LYLKKNLLVFNYILPLQKIVYSYQCDSLHHDNYALTQNDFLGQCPDYHISNLQGCNMP